MNKQIIYFLLFSLTISIPRSIAQNPKKKSQKKVSRLFKSQAILPIKMSYSNSELRKKTNDSTYIESIISYKEKEVWKDVKVEIRARGNFRREKCYFVPVKVKIKKSNAKGTVFKSQKKLKLVVPCLQSRDMNDNVIKEFIAYKFYENISDLNFRTRLVDLSLSEKKRKRIKEHTVKGILIEDDKHVADRLRARIVKRAIHPLEQDDLTSLRNAFFQFMIGNVDFSIAKSHNAKLFYIDKKIYPIPYDFDMNGFIDPSYEVLSSAPKNSFIIDKITERKFRGYKRKAFLFEKVRQEFLTNKSFYMNTLKEYETMFENKNEYSKAKNYIAEFFNILSNDTLYKRKIMNQMRGKK